MAVVQQDSNVSISHYPYNVIWELFPDNGVVLTARQVYESAEPELVTDFSVEKMEGCLERMAAQNFLTRVHGSGVTTSYRLYQGEQSTVLGAYGDNSQPERKSTAKQNGWNGYGFNSSRQQRRRDKGE